MHYWMPFSMMMLLAGVLILASCTPQNERQILTDPEFGKSLDTGYDYDQTTVNEQLEAIREANFSVIRTQMAIKGLSMDSPMLIRAFKSERKLELWVKSAYSPQYELFKSYDVCSTSGTLGPKLKEGDRQTPEGFYDVRPERLNPNSRFFLSFNIGFPNKYDRNLGRTGSHLMIHGSCVSEGCLAMTDEHIGEIYLIVEQNFKYGHKSIPIHIYPFRMTEENMRLRNISRWYPFWENMKEGYDYFERYSIPAKIEVEEDRYIIQENELVYSLLNTQQEIE